MAGVESRNVMNTPSPTITTPLALNLREEHHQLDNNTMAAGDEEAATQHYDQANNYKEGTSTFFKTCFNGFNALSGVGLLTVPYALASGGWLSLILLLIVASASFYTGLLIRRCMDKNSQIRTYTDIGEQAFGIRGRTIVSILMFIDLYLVATGFLIVEGDNLSKLFPNMGFELAGIRIHGRQGFVIMVALIILPTVWLNDLSKLSYISATGAFAAALIIGAVAWVGAIDGVGFHEDGTLFNLKGIPNTISLYVFCYCAHPVIPSLYTSMKNKRQFSKVLLVCFVLCTISYGSMAVLGYLMYGDNVKSQVTLNLPTEKVSSKIAIYTILVTPIAKYALMVTPIVSSIESSLMVYYKNRIFSIMIRTTLLVSSVIVALVFPYFGYLMALVGAFLSSSASMILPTLCYLKITGRYRKWGFELVIIVGIMVMGIVIAVIGTYTSVKQIVNELH